MVLVLIALIDLEHLSACVQLITLVTHTKEYAPYHRCAALKIETVVSMKIASSQVNAFVHHHTSVIQKMATNVRVLVSGSPVASTANAHQPTRLNACVNPVTLETQPSAALISMSAVTILAVQALSALMKTEVLNVDAQLDWSVTPIRKAAKEWHDLNVLLIQNVMGN